MSRRLARQAVMSLLYERDINKEPGENTLLEMKDILKTDEFIERHGDYIEIILSEYEKNQNRVNDIIEANCVGWTIDRLSRVDISILRLAIVEILYTDTPVKVSVNEAVELAKLYSTEKSSSFINGLLASVIKQTGNDI